MPTVYIPPQLKKLTSGARTVEVGGKTLREVVDALEALYPGIKDRLLDGEKFRPGLAAAVDNVVSNRGLLQAVGEESEIHFIPAISGGSY